MKVPELKALTGWLFVLGAILVNIPYALLIANFNYPDVLRLPAGEILIAFHQGGSELVFTWLAFAWSGLPILFAILLLPKALPSIPASYFGAATTLGVIGAIAQVVGLLRWVFVVPVLAQAYILPESSQASKESLLVTFQVLHQFGGVLLGEHIGQIFTILWMTLISLGIFRQQALPRWLGGVGLFAAAVYFLAQGELLATVVPSFPQFGPAGLLGSLLWLAWMAILGICLVRSKEAKLSLS